MASELAPTWGAIHVVLFLETILYGMALLQTWLYFMWYPKDSWKLKCVVLVVAAIETFQIVLYFTSTYTVLIDHFGDYEQLNLISWLELAQYFGGYASAFIVQLYFAWTIYQLSNDRRVKWGVGLMVALAIASLACAIWLTVLTQEARVFSNLDHPADRTAATVQSSTTLACDLLITLFLCIIFRQRKNPRIKRTNHMLHVLSVNAVNRGVLTAVCAVLNVGLFLGLPHKLYYFIGQVLAGKMYMNSLLATLNVRQHIRNIAGTEETYEFSGDMAYADPAPRPGQRYELSNMVFDQGSTTYMSSHDHHGGTTKTTEDV